MRLLPVLLPVLGFALAAVAIGAAAQEPAPSGAAKALHDLFAAEWEYDLEQNPVRASLLGDRRWNDRWPDVSLAAYDRRAAHDREVLSALSRIDRAELSAADQLNYDLFQREYENRLEEHAIRWHLVPLNQRGGVQTTSELAEVLRFETLDDFEDWVARLEGFPQMLDDTIGLMRAGIEARLLQPRLIMERVQGQVQKQIVENPEDSPYFSPLTGLPAGIAAADRERVTRRAREAIATGIVPAFERFATFLEREYVPAAYERVGIWQAPDGEQIYAVFARQFTTTDLAPEAVHEIGLKEVARIRAEMQQIMQAQGFEGTLPEFFEFLRTDPQFYYETPEELLTAYRAIAKRIDPVLVRLFGMLPRTPYGVEPIPELTAPDTTTAYYQQPAADGSRAGTYYVNLYKPETRPKYEMMALSLHEAVPGHHLQIALAMEQEAIPEFRRHAGFTAFVEGWALYAESLGDEVGLYDDPYAKFGQLTYEMWRAVRLVVDTGMHVMKWSRQQAIDYFKANAPKTEQDIVNEIDRYISWPGQALAYKIGELRIKEVRRRAEQALGERFDLRAFHDQVLAGGPLPLDILERRVEAWIDSQ